MKTRLLFLNQCFDKTRLRNLIAWVLFAKGEKETIEIVEKLKGLGFQFATRAGISLSIDDLKIPSEKAPLVSQAKQQVSLAASQYEKGNVTSIEKLQQLVDTWHRTSETLKQTVVSNFQATDKLSPVYMMAFSGARGNISQVRQLAGMRGLMADPQGQIIGFPIRSNFREGLTLTEYMISCYGARKGLVDTALRTADAGYLTRRLVDVSQHMVVKASTCATRRGIVLYELTISGKSALSLRDRLVGRVLAQDVYAVGAPQRPQADIEERQEAVTSPRVMHLLGSLRGPEAKGPNNVAKVGERNQEISADLASQIASVQKRVSVRSPLTCSIRHGVCQLCYGWSLSEGRLVNLGEAVGIIAAQSIGEPGTQLTMRTFHTGGVFSGDVMTEIRAPYEGTIHFSNPLQGLLIRTSHGKIAFLTKSSGKVAIQPYINCKDNNVKGSRIASNAMREVVQTKLEETRFPLEASTVVFVRQHERVIQTQLIAEFSSMGIEINETIEAKRTLFANNAGQVSFASLLIGRRIRENGDIDRVSRSLGFVSILSGKQPGPVALLDLLQRGTHIVNQNTIVAKVASLDGVGPSPLGSKKKGNETPFLTWQSPLLLGGRTQRALVAGFDAAKAVRRFLPSLLYSWIRLTNDNTKKLYLASSNQSTIERGGQSLSSGNGNENCQQDLPVLFRPISLHKETGITPALVSATSPIREVNPPQGSPTLNRSALCKQPYLSYSPLTVAHSLSTNRAVGKRVTPSMAGGGQRTPDKTSVCIFPSQYQTPRNGLTWFDSRYLSRRLNLGELIWIETEAPSPYRGNSIATILARPTGRITAVNPLAGQPSTYNKLDRSNVEQQTDGVSMVTPSLINSIDDAGGGLSIASNARTPLIATNEGPSSLSHISSLCWQSEKSNMSEREVEYFVTSTNFPTLFCKERQVPFDCLVNKESQQQTSSRAALNTVARLAARRPQQRKLAATKSWIVTFEKSQSFSKQKALNIQRDYFSREPLINGRVNKATTSQKAKDHLFLFKDVGVRKRERGSTEPMARQQKNSHHWVYCPQEIQRVSTMHESINFYRNRQLDKLAFDSSLVYTKALFTFELSYSVKNSLACIAGKLLLSSERGTNTSQIKSPPLVQTLRREMIHWRPGFLTADFTISPSAFKFRSHPIINSLDERASCQDVTRQYSSLYFNFLDLPSNLLPSNVTNRENKPFAESNLAASVSSWKAIEAFNTPSSIESYYKVICVILQSMMKDIVEQCSNRFLLHFAGFKGAMSFDTASKIGQFELRIDETPGSESHTVGQIQPFAKGRALGFGFGNRPKSLDVFPQQRGAQMRGLDGHSQGSTGSVKKEGLLFLRKWMQVPQGYALHERTVSFEKWDEALPLADVLKTELDVPNSVDFVESGSQSSPSFNSIEGCTVKISALSDLKRGYKLSFDRRNCFQLPLGVKASSKHKELGSIKIRSSSIKLMNTLETFDLQETGKTERYRFLVWKNLMNCKPFLLLRTCSLQMHVVSNTKARHFLPSSIEHPLTWHNLIHPLDMSREKLGWHKAEDSNNLRAVSQLEAVQSSMINNEIDIEVLEHRRRQKGFLHQLSLRQQITLGPLSLDIDRRESFFDNLKKQGIGGQPQAEPRVSGVSETPSIVRSLTGSSLNRTNGQLYEDVTKVQQKRVFWPYSPKATLLTAMYKGSSIPLPSKTNLTINCTTQSDFVVAERIRTLPRTGFANVLQSKINESNSFTVGKRDREGEASMWLNSPHNFALHFINSFISSSCLQSEKSNVCDEHDSKMNKRGLRLPKLYTFRFDTKTRQTPLITNRKPNYFSLTSLLLTSNFCTKVVSNNSYLIRFLGTTTLSSTNQSSRDVLTSYNTRDQSVSLRERLSPAVGELVSQDLHHNGRYLGMSTSWGRGFDGPSNPPKANDGKGLPFGAGVSMASLSSIKLMMSNTVLLTESDQISMSLSKQRANVSVGQFVTLGEEFVWRHAALVSGQVVAIERDKITLRQAQALLFYAQGVTHVNHGQWVNRNAPILTLTYQKLVTGDIVQGIPKIEQFFEAPATRDGEPLPNSLQSRLRKTYNRLKRSLPQVQAVKHSLEEIQQVLVEGILRVYLSQGVRIADKHLEIVIRQMTSKGQILDVGNTGLFQGEFVSLDRIERINLGTYGQKAEYEPSVLGITQASLGAESFISAASFQETTRVLSRDTIVGKTDFLRGLKERVVLGDVIQAGTGLDDNINYGLLFGTIDT
jgi:hypothetical protein